ncbi:MAG TPA: NAD(P)-dependent oxidoreductase [Candidatus Acidoferrales bacterium]|nr:NAD(P)-dependent oxidoreductase [Candidatus Acidoferrales bacterium]
MTLKSLSVACIGLGRMGAGLARNIQSAGFPLTVYNRTIEKTKPFVASGATLAKSPREAASAADVVVTNLMDDASVLGAMTGDDGILAGMRPGAIHIGTTTISPSLTTRLAEMHSTGGSHYVACPVAGRPDAAGAGKLYSFVAGDPQIIERCRPVIDTYTMQLIPVGKDPALGASMKLVGNFFGASLLEVVGEAVVFAEKRGVLAPFGNMLKSLLPVFGEYWDRIQTRNYDNPGFTLDGGLKDVTLMIEAAAEMHVPLPCASLIRDKCLAAQARGMGQLDWCCFTEISRLNADQQ